MKKEIKKYSLEIFQIDINKNYFITDDLEVYSSQDDFDNELLENEIEDYTGIKDNIEQWLDERAEERELAEIKGSEAIAIIYQNQLEMTEYWKNRYYETMEKEGK